jgi:hypothetical protein
VAVLLPQGVTITYQLQRRRCGRASCRACQEGPGHGPYWYAYWRGSDGKLRSGYIGKALPPGVTPAPPRRQAGQFALHEGTHKTLRTGI